jgi:tRNA(adenine34) deaminase
VEDNNAMSLALEQARAAMVHGDVPVGAVILANGALVAMAHNRREVDRDPLAHAEILAIKTASRRLGRWRLSGCSLIVTLEPCPMCAGALVHARIDRLVFATTDPRTGACGSIMNLVQDPRLNHHVDIISGVCADQAAEMLREFFRARRK